MQLPHPWSPMEPFHLSISISLSCSLCVSERLPIIKKVQVLAEEEEEVARRDSDMSIDDSDFL